MPAPARLGLFYLPIGSKRPLYAIVAAVAVTVAPFLLWRRLTAELLATDFLPHLYCYLIAT